MTQQNDILSLESDFLNIMDVTDNMMCVVDGNMNIQKIYSANFGKAYGEEFIAEMEEFLKDDFEYKDGLSSWSVLNTLDLMTSIDKKTNIPFYKEYKKRLLSSDGKPRFLDGLYHHDSYPLFDEDLNAFIEKFFQAIGINLILSCAEDELESDLFDKIMGWSDASEDDDFNCSLWTPNQSTNGNGNLLMIAVTETGLFAIHAVGVEAVEVNT